MLSYKTHLTVVETCASLHPSASAFRLPVVDAETNEIREWRVITFQQFLSHVEHFARYWSQTLKADGLTPRSVVGVWLSGTTYVDLLHIYGITRAGYIPQLFSLRLPNPDVIYELLARSEGKALIFDSSFESIMKDGPIPTHIAVDARDLAVKDISLPPIYSPQSGDEPVMIFHTSGSTSGRPKLVPCSYTWWNFAIEKSARVTVPLRSGRRDVTVWMGSVCHIGQTFMLLGALQHGMCTVQYTRQNFSSEELLDMINRCGLTRINQFPTFLNIHLRNSRHDPKLLAQLKALDEIFISGMPLTSDDAEWVQRHGLKIINCFGSTESGAMLLSARGEQNRLFPVTPIAGASYAFIPTSSTAQPEAGYQNVNGQFLELVILPESADCPDPLLRKEDGLYHTGDLFQEVAPSKYIFRGRDDDWIKSESSLRCDTKAIEDNVRETCGDLIEACIVVGNGRPSPALLVEPKEGLEVEKLKKDIIRRTRHFHSRRYLHERITSTQFVLVVPSGTLPRTASKGNIRRRAVEEAFASDLNRVYGVAH